MTTTPPSPSPHQLPPFKVGDRVRGTSYVPPDRRKWDRPEAFEGVVVQVGSGYTGVDAKLAFLWTRLADGTERQSLVSATTLMVEPAETMASQ